MFRLNDDDDIVPETSKDDNRSNAAQETETRSALPAPRKLGTPFRMRLLQAISGRNLLDDVVGVSDPSKSNDEVHENILKLLRVSNLSRSLPPAVDEQKKLNESTFERLYIYALKLSPLQKSLSGDLPVTKSKVALFRADNDLKLSSSADSASSIGDRMSVNARIDDLNWIDDEAKRYYGKFRDQAFRIKKTIAEMSDDAFEEFVRKTLRCIQQSRQIDSDFIMRLRRVPVAQLIVFMAICSLTGDEPAAILETIQTKPDMLYFFYQIQLQKKYKQEDSPVTELEINSTLTP